MLVVGLMGLLWYSQVLVYFSSQVLTDGAHQDSHFLAVLLIYTWLFPYDQVLEHFLGITESIESLGPAQ